MRLSSINMNTLSLYVPLIICLPLAFYFFLLLSQSASSPWPLLPHQSYPYLHHHFPPQHQQQHRFDHLFPCDDDVCAYDDEFSRYFVLIAHWSFTVVFLLLWWDYSSKDSPYLITRLILPVSHQSTLSLLVLNLPSWLFKLLELSNCKSIFISLQTTIILPLGDED